MQQQGQQYNNARGSSQRLKQLPWKRLIFFLVAFFLIAGGATLWILNSNNKGPWSSALSIIFVALGIVVVLLQWLFPLSTHTPNPHMASHIQSLGQPLSPGPTFHQSYAPILASLPSAWNVPFQRNPFFTGREDLLNYLRNKLHADKTAALTQPQAISGLGGIGKTQTAVEYAYRYRNDYQYVLWATADARETLLSNFVTIASLLNLPERNAQDQNLVVDAVKRWLQTHTGWLLILDNADDLEMARDFLPTGGKGHILLTTRSQATGNIEGIDIEKMEPEVGTLFLLRRAKIIKPDAPLNTAPAADRDIASKIVGAVDGLPLALDQAGAYIEETQCGLANYLDLYQKQRTELLNERRGVVSDHPAPVATTWSLSFQKVQRANPASADLLCLCAFLAPDAIPEEIITRGAPYLGQILQPVATDPGKLNGAIGELRKYSLVRRNPVAKTLTIHRLVQAVLKDEMSKKTQHQWAERAVRAVNHVFPEVKYETWPQCKRYLPHAQVCQALIEEWDIAFPEAGRLLNLTGWYLRESGQYTEAEPFSKRGLAILERALGAEHVEVANNLANLATLYQVLGRYTEAEPLYQRSLAIYQKIYGPEHPYVATSLESLALLYGIQGRYAQAEPLYQRALTINERQLEPGPSNLARSILHLGWLYYMQGKYREAEPLYQRAIEVGERGFGPEDPDLAIIINHLANLYGAQGKYARAEQLFERGLAILEKALGQEHPEVAQSLNSLAYLYSSQGKYAEAEPLYRRALAIDEKTLGLEHPEVALVLEFYADLLRKTKRKAEARKLEARAKAIRDKHAWENPA